MRIRYNPFPGICNGSKDRFRYRGDTFFAKRAGSAWVVTRLVTGDRAQCAFPIAHLADLWNVADCLQLYESHIYIDEDYVIHLLKT